MDADPSSDEPRRFTVDEVYRMVEAGVIDKDERVELIEGRLWPKGPNDPPHAGTLSLLSSRLHRLYGRMETVRVQSPLHISRYSEPEPDLVVARGHDDQFMTRHPRGPDCILVIEVCWCTRRRDIRKATLYAEAGVKVYWILDLEARRLEVFANPTPDGYADVRTLGEAAPDEIGVPETDATWRVADLLPKH
jgi:Uma2 family endonuclease